MKWWTIGNLHIIWCMAKDSKHGSTGTLSDQLKNAIWSSSNEVYIDRVIDFYILLSSPAYSIRSYAYVGVHALVGKLLFFFMPDKARIYCRENE